MSTNTKSSKLRYIHMKYYTTKENCCTEPTDVRDLMFSKKKADKWEYTHTHSIVPLTWRSRASKLSPWTEVRRVVYFGEMLTGEKGMMEPSGNVLYLNLSGIYIYKNVLSYTSMICAFCYMYKLCVNFLQNGDIKKCTRYQVLVTRRFSETALAIKEYIFKAWRIRKLSSGLG